MKELEEKHWTNDDELIERYVLNRLNADERNELEDHLRVCEVCKRAVRAEQVLVAGIRRGGREQFKAEFSKKVASRPESKTPWVQILSAAAVIVILVTVGIYNRWFETQSVEQTTNVGNTSLPAGRDSFAKKSDVAIAEQQPPPLEEKRESSPSDERSPHRKSTGSEQRERSATQVETSGGIPAGEGMASKDVQAQSPRDGRGDDAAAPMAAAKEAPLMVSAGESGGEWIEGEILLSAENALLDKSIRRLHETEAKSQPYARNERSDASAERAKKVKTQNAELGTITLSQQHSRSLPPTQLHRQQMHTTSRVTTRMERVGDGTLLTLYLDSLVDERELSNATIETPQPDSLIVNFSNQRIGYKLPSYRNQPLPTMRPK